MQMRARAQTLQHTPTKVGDALMPMTVEAKRTKSGF